MSAIKKSQQNAAAKRLCEITSTLTQILKQVNGLYDVVLTEGMTTDQYFASYGVIRPKGGSYKMAMIKQAWCCGMKIDGELAMFKNLTAIYTEGVDEDKKTYKVYTRANAEKFINGGKDAPMRVSRLQKVGENAWSIRVLTNGFKQNANYAKLNKDAEASEKAYTEAEEYCIIRTRTSKNEKGETIITKTIEVVDFADVELA